MPHGFFTIEQWKRPRAGQPPQWQPVFQLDAYQSLTKAMQQLQQRGEPGLFRVVQMQRCIWAEMENGELKLHGSHASTPESLARLAKLFDEEGGRRPVEKARLARQKAKAARKKK
ncbi:MAG TPA: hypothetical protein VFE46_17680 [Pirellulales bacterium]|jgi:hypothetical protein|nr:hypothetical protein [Pirellulales bacterium]